MNSNLIREAKEYEYRPTNLIDEICTSMVLLNNTFLDNILGKKNTDAIEDKIFEEEKLGTL